MEVRQVAPCGGELSRGGGAVGPELCSGVALVLGAWCVRITCLVRPDFVLEKQEELVRETVASTLLAVTNANGSGQDMEANMDVLMMKEAMERFASTARWVARTNSTTSGPGLSKRNKW